MAKYNTTFELNIEEIELIEAALRSLQREGNVPDSSSINALLGRLHNQKIFFRPRDGAYISG